MRHLGLRIISKMYLFSARSLLLYKIAYCIDNMSGNGYTFFTRKQHVRKEKECRLLRSEVTTFNRHLPKPSLLFREHYLYMHFFLYESGRVGKDS